MVCHGWVLLIREQHPIRYGNEILDSIYVRLLHCHSHLLYKKVVPSLKCGVFAQSQQPGLQDFFCAPLHSRTDYQAQISPHVQLLYSKAELLNPLGKHV